MSKKPKTREMLEEILASCSDTLFPEQMGQAAVNIDSCDVDGDTPLHVMLWRNNTYGALSLIEAGADVNAVGDMSETPLHVAVRKANIEVIEALLKRGARLTARSEFGNTPLQMAENAGGEIKRCFNNR